MFEHGTYHPHFEDCYFCHAAWSDDNQPIGWHEHYICSSCDRAVSRAMNQEEEGTRD